tara:strand:- start:191 stop:481 length:291 start_codon:yes stop_codon:yes gene_type:complete
MAFKMKGSAFKLGNVATKSALKQVHTHPGKWKAHNPMEKHDPPLHQHLVGGRGNKQPKKGLARLWEIINPFDEQSKRKRQERKSRSNIAKKNTWRS